MIKNHITHSRALKYSENSYIIVNSQGFHKGLKVNPFFHTICEIPFRIFLSFHYRTSKYHGNTLNAISSRKRVIRDLIYKTRKEMGLKAKDIHFFGSAEQGISNRVHTHTLLYL